MNTGCKRPCQGRMFGGGSMKTDRPEVPQDRTAELEEKLQTRIGKGPESYTAADWTSLREQFRLPLLYPGCHVAFRDHHEGEGAARRLVCREVVCVGHNLEEVQQHVAALPDEQLRGVFIEAVPGPKNNKRGHARP
jgi:hypothetical protein